MSQINFGIDIQPVLIFNFINNKLINLDKKRFILIQQATQTRSGISSQPLKRRTAVKKISTDVCFDIGKHPPEVDVMGGA